MDTIRLIIGGKHIELNSLDSNLDQQFTFLYSAYFSNATLNWTDFEKAAFKFFNSSSREIETHDAYFGNFTIIWNSYLSAANYAEAERIWKMALNPVLEYEKTNPGMRIHKGTAYYFWGMTVLLSGDLDRGYVLMHRGVEEDVLTQGINNPDTPGFAFASLNYGKADQAFKQWVIQQAKFLNELQNVYSSTYGRSFILDDFKNNFLSKPPNTETIFLFGYAVARLMSLLKLPSHALKSTFAGQLEINILFDIVLVIDNAIKSKNPSHSKFISHAVFLLSKTNYPLKNAHLREINESFTNDLDGTLIAILEGTYLLTGGNALTKLQSDVAIVYGLRNHAAHDVSSIPTIRDRFSDIQQAIMNVLFATVDYLYQ